MRCILNFLRMAMFHIKRCTKQKMFSKLSVPFVEITNIGTLGNTNQFESTHMHILIINNCNSSHILSTRAWLQSTYKLKYIHYPIC